MSSSRPPPQALGYSFGLSTAYVCCCAPCAVVQQRMEVAKSHAKARARKDSARKWRQGVPFTPLTPPHPAAPAAIVSQPNFVMDCALSCCCPSCVILQNANQVRLPPARLRCGPAAATICRSPPHKLRLCDDDGAAANETHSLRVITGLHRRAGNPLTRCGPQVGKKACFTEWTMEQLLAPPTPEEIEKQKNAAKTAAEDAKAGAKA